MITDNRKTYPKSPAQSFLDKINIKLHRYRAKIANESYQFPIERLISDVERCNTLHCSRREVIDISRSFAPQCYK